MYPSRSFHNVDRRSGACGTLAEAPVGHRAPAVSPFSKAARTAHPSTSEGAATLLRSRINLARVLESSAGFCVSVSVLVLCTLVKRAAWSFSKGLRPSGPGTRMGAGLPCRTNATNVCTSPRCAATSNAETLPQKHWLEEIRKWS